MPPLNSLNKITKRALARSHARTPARSHARALARPWQVAMRRIDIGTSAEDDNGALSQETTAEGFI